MMMEEPATGRIPTATSHLLALAREGALRPSCRNWFYPVAALLAVPLMLLVSQIAAAIVLGAMMAITGSLDQLEATLNSFTGQMVTLIVGFVPLVILVWLWLWLFERRGPWTVGLERAGAGRAYLRGLLVGLGLFSLAVALFALPGFVATDAGGVSSYGGQALGGVLLLFLGWMVQGGAEEVLTRGFLLPVIAVRWGTPAGIILSSLVFTVLHFLNPNVSLLAALNLFLFGVFASVYALHEGGLWGICAIHSVWNWAQGNLYGFEVSGQEGNPSLMLVNLRETGPDWLTGGPFGPEGGLAVTVVLIAATLLVMGRARRTRARPVLG